MCSSISCFLVVTLLFFKCFTVSKSKEIKKIIFKLKIEKNRGISSNYIRNYLK